MPSLKCRASTEYADNFMIPYSSINILPLSPSQSSVSILFHSFSYLIRERLDTFEILGGMTPSKDKSQLKLCSDLRTSCRVEDYTATDARYGRALHKAQDLIIRPQKYTGKHAEMSQ